VRVGEVGLDKVWTKSHLAIPSTANISNEPNHGSKVALSALY
jgi:hypothetical protein